MRKKREPVFALVLPLFNWKRKSHEQIVPDTRVMKGKHLRRPPPHRAGEDNTVPKRQRRGGVVHVVGTRETTAKVEHQGSEEVARTRWCVKSQPVTKS